MKKRVRVYKPEAPAKQPRKKKVKHEANAPQNSTTDSIIAQKTGTMEQYLKNNTYDILAKEEAALMDDFMRCGGVPTHLQQGGGVNLNNNAMAYANAFADMQGQAMGDFKGFIGESANLANSIYNANQNYFEPGGEYSYNPALARTPEEKAWITSNNIRNSYIPPASNNASRQASTNKPSLHEVVTNAQQGVVTQNTPASTQQRYPGNYKGDPINQQNNVQYYNQGYGAIPYMGNPYSRNIGWFPQNNMFGRRRSFAYGTPGYGMPAVPAFNPNNTFLESYEAKKRLFGPGARKVKMTFGHYGTPPQGVNPNVLNIKPSGDSKTSNKGVSGADLMAESAQMDADMFANQNINPTRDTTMGYDDAMAMYNEQEKLRGIRKPMGTGNGYSADQATADALNKMQQRPLPSGVPNTQQAYEDELEMLAGQMAFGGVPTFYQDGGPFDANGRVQKRGPNFDTGFNRDIATSEVVANPYMAKTGESEAVWKNKMGLGPEIADWGLAGMSALSSLGEGDERRALEEQMMGKMFGDNMANVVGAGDASRGDFTVNRGDFRPDQTTVIQNPGYNTGMIGSGQYTKMGGNIDSIYAVGGEYELSDGEIEAIMKAGGQIEYID